MMYLCSVKPTALPKSDLASKLKSSKTSKTFNSTAL